VYTPYSNPIISTTACKNLLYILGILKDAKYANKKKTRLIKTLSLNTGKLYGKRSYRQMEDNEIKMYFVLKLATTRKCFMLPAV